MEFYEVKKRYLAEALSFLGFRYYKKGFGENTIYSFKNTEKFSKALNELTILKNKFKEM